MGTVGEYMKRPGDCMQNTVIAKGHAFIAIRGNAERSDGMLLKSVTS